MYSLFNHFFRLVVIKNFRLILQVIMFSRHRKHLSFAVCYSVILIRSDLFWWGLNRFEHIRRGLLLLIEILITNLLILCDAMFSSDLGEKVFLSPYKILMLEALLIFCIARFVKVVHVKLTHERAEVIVFEILGQNILCKRVRVFNYKPISCLVPKYCIRIRWVLNTHDLVLKYLRWQFHMSSSEN